MKRPSTERRMPILAVAFVLSACAGAHVVVAPEPEPGVSAVAPLDIPPGHLPPPGECRV